MKRIFLSLLMAFVFSGLFAQSIDKAKELLNFVPTISLEQGMQELSEWYFEKIKLTVTE